MQGDQGADCHDVDEGHWINGDPTPIAHPMSGHPLYSARRKDWGINGTNGSTAGNGRRREMADRASDMSDFVCVAVVALPLGYVPRERDREEKKGGLLLSEEKTRQKKRGEKH